MVLQGAVLAGHLAAVEFRQTTVLDRHLEVACLGVVVQTILFFLECPHLGYTV